MSLQNVMGRYEIAAQEDRSAPRTRLSIPAQLRQSGGRPFQTVVNDLSLSGFSATSVSRLHVGTVCWLTLPGLEAFAINPTPLAAVGYEWLGRFHRGGKFAGRRINLTATT